MVLFWVTPRSSKHQSEFLFETYFLQTFYPHPQDFSRTPPGHFPILSLLPTAELKHFWDARRARWPSLSLSLSPRPRRHRQPHSSVHQGPVGTGQDKLPGKRELLVPWPVQLHCFLFLRIHPALYWVICPVFFFLPVTPRQLPPLVIQKITVIEWKVLIAPFIILGSHIRLFNLFCLGTPQRLREVFGLNQD